MLGSHLITNQTGPEGQLVQKVRPHVFVLCGLCDGMPLTLP